MSKRAGLALTIATATLFLILNRSAYKGYFQDDDFSTLSWARFVPDAVFSIELLSPRLSPKNFRPIGAFYYRWIENRFGLDFPKYLVPLHALHLLNIWLLWLIVRRLGISAPGATAAAFFFGFHAALIDAWWKPMFVFDILCATFSLLTLLLYAHHRWILSFFSFWLAYKSKELAIMLPAVLACYELWFGERRWKQLIPFFAVALLFGLQAALMLPVHQGTPYEMQLGPAAQAQTITYYSSQLFFIPYAGLLVLALPLGVRDRRVWLGVAAMCLLIIPLLLLPERLYAVYLYLPLIGAAIALASLADGRYRALAAVFLVLWIPWDFKCFRQMRRVNQQREQQNHAYVNGIEAFARLNPEQRLFVYDYLPEGFHHWGVIGALSCVYRISSINAQYVDEPGAKELIQNGDAAWLHWNSSLNRLDVVRNPSWGTLLTYLKMDVSSPPAQLLEGWYQLEEGFRWTKPDAIAVLLRPEGARSFEVAACLPPEQIVQCHVVSLQVMLDAKPLGRHEFTAPGCQTVRWPAPPGSAGVAKVEFRITPPYPAPKPDPRVLGLPIMAFGFPSE
jgi:hypothetical protein